MPCGQERGTMEALLEKELGTLAPKQEPKKCYWCDEYRNDIMIDKVVNLRYGKCGGTMTVGQLCKVCYTEFTHRLGKYAKYAGKKKKKKKHPGFNLDIDKLTPELQKIAKHYADKNWSVLLNVIYKMEKEDFEQYILCEMLDHYNKTRMRLQFVEKNCLRLNHNWKQFFTWKALMCCRNLFLDIGQKRIGTPKEENEFLSGMNDVNMQVYYRRQYEQELYNKAQIMAVDMRLDAKEREE